MGGVCVLKRAHRVNEILSSVLRLSGSVVEGRSESVLVAVFSVIRVVFSLKQSLVDGICCI